MQAPSSEFFPHWSARAACTDPKAPSMFPHEGDTKGNQVAKETCAKCPVQAECLALALERGEEYGIWGGLDVAERKAAKRRVDRRAGTLRVNRKRSR